MSQFSATAADQDTIRQHCWSAELLLVLGMAITADEYEKKWLKNKTCMAVQVGMWYAALPQDSDAYAQDYGCPVFTAGLRYHLNRGVTMHWDQDPAWGLLEPADYTSKMGTILTGFASFAHPLLRIRHWEADYTLSAGIGYFKEKYNTYNAIDNELIGSRWLIYFGASFGAAYHICPDWGIRAGLEFCHHSNGALNRPNKGANVIGTTIGLVYEPYYPVLAAAPKGISRKPFRRYWFSEIALGVGAKTLNEDWQLTQFRTPPDAPNYRTSEFHRYPAYSLQGSLLYRYARRWASRLGVDDFYDPYADHVVDIYRQQGIYIKHSPWLYGLSAKHRVYYHNLSVDMSLGWYLYRHMGDNARQVETPYYERIGLHYAIQKLGGLSVGIDVKAHYTKADYTEVIIGWPIKYKKDW